MAETALSLPRLDPRIFRLLGHELRYAIFMKLGERPWSAKELAPVLGVDWKRISEQIGILLKEDVVERVGTEPGPRGGMRHLYRAGRFYFTAEEWAALPEAERETVNFTISRVLIREITDALETGSFESHESHALLRHPLWTDDQGVREIEQIMVRAHQEVEAVERNRLRREDSGATAVRLITAFLSFPAAP